MADSCASSDITTPIVSEVSILSREKDLGSTGSQSVPHRLALFSNPQSDDSVLAASLAVSSDFVRLPMISELSEVDDQYAKLKAHSARLKE